MKVLLSSFAINGHNIGLKIHRRKDTILALYITANSTKVTFQWLVFLWSQRISEFTGGKVPMRPDGSI